jgi:hypothetical protein
MISSVSQAFWYGEIESLYANIGDETIESFFGCLDSGVFPYLDTDIDRTDLQKDWYRKLNMLLEELSLDGKDALNQCLNSHILPELDVNLEFIENRADEEGVTIYNHRRSYGGYTLLSSIMGHGCDQLPLTDVLSFPVVDDGNLISMNTCGAILIDMQGNIVKEWPLMAVPAKMLPDGNVLGMAMTMFPVNGPPIGGLQAMVQVDWYGNEKWRWSGPLSAPVLGGARVHHDFQRDGNAVGYYAPGQEPSLLPEKSLVLSNIISPNPPSAAEDLIVPEISNFELLEDAFYEVDVNGNITWAWYPYEHFEQMGFDRAASSAIKHVRVAGIGGVSGGEGTTDWQHINSVSYLGPNRWYDEDEEETWIFHPDNIIYDSRTSNYLAIIARVEHPLGKWKIDDIVWRVGPHFTEDDPGNNIGQIIGPHMAHMIPQGLPGAGNILVFDNGGVAGYGALLPGLPGTYPATYRDYSRVIEFNPLTFKVVWEYQCKKTGKNGRKFYSRLISGAQRLENGNTLITEGGTGRVFEVSPKGEIVWEYIHKAEYANGAFGLLGFLPPTAIYRAYRIPEAWLPVSAFSGD